MPAVVPRTLKQLAAEAIGTPARGHTVYYNSAGKLTNLAPGTAGQALLATDVGAGAIEPRWGAVSDTTRVAKAGDTMTAALKIDPSGNALAATSLLHVAPSGSGQQRVAHWHEPGFPAPSGVNSYGVVASSDAGTGIVRFRGVAAGTLDTRSILELDRLGNRVAINGAGSTYPPAQLYVAVKSHAVLANDLGFDLEGRIGQTSALMRVYGNGQSSTPFLEVANNGSVGIGLAQAAMLGALHVKKGAGTYGQIIIQDIASNGTGSITLLKFQDLNNQRSGFVGPADSGNLHMYLGGMGGIFLATGCNSDSNQSINPNLWSYLHTDGRWKMSDAAITGVSEASALMDLASTTKALLLPRLPTASVATPVNGMVIYDSDTNKFRGRAGGAWVDLH